MEVNNTVCKCIQCVVLTLCNVLAWEVLITALANDNVTCDNLLATPDLTPKRFEADSRPFLNYLHLFLCAILKSSLLSVN